MGLGAEMVVPFFLKEGPFSSTNVVLLCMHVVFEFGFINWSIFGHLVHG